jgi:DNA segregation ATPase FtsK/SpoIIIE, S-DNA-T family
MMRVPRGATTRRGRPSASHSWWTPRRLQRQREDRELARWATELGWQWSETMDGVHLAHHTRTAGGLYHIAAPLVHSADPGPPVTLLVEMLPGQIIEDFQSQAHRIAEGMGVPMVRIAPAAQGLIKVGLLDHDSLRAAMSP